MVGGDDRRYSAMKYVHRVQIAAGTDEASRFHSAARVQDANHPWL